MADQPATEKPDAPAPAADVPAAPAGELGGKEEPKAEEVSKEEPAGKTDEPIIAADKTEEKKDEGKEEDKAPAEGDTELPDVTETSMAVDADQSTADASGKADAPKAPARRKSTAGNRKSLNKKASKAKMTHLDAKPGDHFLVKLKGFPEWPAIICDESMLPQALLTSRPVTAARPDGTYAEPYADGGKRAGDRNFPVMYLHTNEFGWVINTALTELTPEMAKSALEGKLRKDLKAAFELAAEGQSLDHYKGILKSIEEEIQKAQEAEEAAAAAAEAAAAAAAATPKKGKKAKAKAGDDEDVEMADGDASTSKPKKRKAQDDASTPQRSDSVKKPKIKLNTSSTPKNTNGTSSKDASGKAKPKKAEKKEASKEKMTPEERLARKEKEVLYLRYKLQRGLLNKDQPPKPEEMKQMSDYVSMLEGFSGLEVAIIRNTRINKVLKQIMKLPSIPHEEEHKFKHRSQVLLDKWNQVMTADTPTNGVNGTEAHADEKKPETNGSEEKEDAKPAETEKATEAAKSAEPEKPAESETKVEEPAKEAPEAVEASA